MTKNIGWVTNHDLTSQKEKHENNWRDSCRSQNAYVLLTFRMHAKCWLAFVHVHGIFSPPEFRMWRYWQRQVHICTKSYIPMAEVKTLQTTYSMKTKKVYDVFAVRRCTQTWLALLFSSESRIFFSTNTELKSICTAICAHSNAEVFSLPRPGHIFATKKPWNDCTVDAGRPWSVISLPSSSRLSAQRWQKMEIHFGCNFKCSFFPFTRRCSTQLWIIQKPAP